MVILVVAITCKSNLALSALLINQEEESMPCRCGRPLLNANAADAQYVANGQPSCVDCYRSATQLELPFPFKLERQPIKAREALWNGW